MNPQTDNSLSDFDQTLEHRKATTCCSHNEAKQEIYGSNNIVSGTGNVAVHVIQQEQDKYDYKDLINHSKIQYYLLLLGFMVRFFYFSHGEVKEVISLNIVLIFVTFLLGCLWLMSAEHELRILEQHLGECLYRGKLSPSYNIIFNSSVYLYIINYY